MAIVINGSGTVTGLAVGGLPDGTVDADTVAADVATQAEIDLKANIANFTSTGIDDNATSTAITVNSSGSVNFAGLIGEITGAYCKLRIRDDSVSDTITIDSRNLTASAKGNIRFTTTDSVGNASERLKIMGDGRGVSQFTAKAWINMSNTTTRDSHNVSSTSDNGTGDFSIYFDADMANVNYVPLTGQEGGFDVCRFNSHHTSYVGEYRLQTGYQTSNGSLTKADVGSIFYAFFGD